MSPPQEPLTISHPDEFNLTDLVHSIHQVLGDKGLDSEHIDANDIIALMNKYSSDITDWSRYTLFDHSRAYTRNLIDDGNGKFNLMILAWSKGQKSPIHDHSGSHCVMKILDGELQETLYEWPSTIIGDDDGAQDITEATTMTNTAIDSSPLVVSKNTIYQPNQVTYVHDKIGLHRISNPSSEHGAVSLHLYTPPYKVCKTFNETTGKARSSGICSFYSVGGTRIQ